MTIKNKWNELDKKKKIIVGIGSAVAVAAVGTGAIVGANAADQPAQTKVAETPRTSTDKVKDVSDENKEKDKLAGTDKESENVRTDDSKSDKLDKKDDENNDKEDEKSKETVTVKEDGTKVTVKQSTSNTPSATVKVEKETKTESNKSSSSNSSSSKPFNSDKSTSVSPESKPKDTITTKTTTDTQSIAFKTVNQNDSTLEKGKTKVAQNGQNGVKTITYEETYKNGKLISKDQVSSKVTKNPVDKIVKVGTKEAPKAPTYQSASQAHSILGGSGMTRNGNTYELALGEEFDVYVTVGGNHVTGISFIPSRYIPWKIVTKDELIAIFGPEQGNKEYNIARDKSAKIEKAVRAAANAVYGSGTSQANNLYNQLIKSERSVSKSF